MKANPGGVAAPTGAIVVVCRPSRACQDLIDEMRRHGVRSEVRSLDWRFEPPSETALLAVFLIDGYSYGAREALRRRVEEIREFDPALPIMALVQDSRADLLHLANAGLSSFVVGFPWDGPAADFLSGVAAASPRRAAVAPVLWLPGREDVVFTAREMQTLQRLRHGVPNKIIAKDLGISTRTVKAYVCRVLAKLGVSTRSEAIAVLAKYDLPEIPGTFRLDFQAQVKPPAPQTPQRRGAS